MMEPIESIADLLGNNAHWSVYEFVQGRASADTVTDLLATRYGDRLTASPETITQFETIVRRSMRAAETVAAGDVPALADIPAVPIPNVRTRFSVQGVVTVVAPELGADDQPLESTVPFQTQTQTLPSLADINAEIGTAIADQNISGSSVSASHRKAKQRSQYIRGRGEAVEYDISPFFVWRTS